MKRLKLCLVISLIALACQNDPLPTGSGTITQVESINVFISNDTDFTYVITSKKIDELDFADGLIINAGETDQLSMEKCCSHVIRAYIKSDLTNHKFEWHVNPRAEDMHISF